MKKSDLIRANIENLKEEAKELVNKTDATLEDLNAIDNKIAVEEKKLEIQLKNEEKERAAASEGATNLPEATAGVTEENKIDNKERNRVLALAICGKASQSDLAKISNLLQEGEDSKGGLLVPPDIKTKIIELQRKQFDIRKYVKIEPTKVQKGSRPKQKNEPQASGFASVDEGAEIQALHEPEIESVEYAIRKYSGYIPITNELLDDSPENILAFVIDWMSKNELNTYAYQIFNGSGLKAAEGILNSIKTGGKLETRVVKLETAPTLKDFKRILNLNLEEVESDNIKIFTNGSGYSYIDELEDGFGRPLLQPDVTKESGYAFLGKEAVKVPTKFLKQVVLDDVEYTPYIIGDLELLYTMYDRDDLLIETTTVGGTAWRTGTTEVKGTFRFDGKINGDIKSVVVMLAKHEATSAIQNYSRANSAKNVSIALQSVVNDNKEAMEKLTEAIVTALGSTKETSNDV